MLLVIGELASGLAMAQHACAFGSGCSNEQAVFVSYANSSRWATIHIETGMFDRLGIAYDARGIGVDDYLRTNVPSVWAIGDATGKSILAHVGMQQGSVVLLQAGFRALTGTTSQIAVVLSTLAIAALFFPVRQRAQAIIDRRFYRRKYDAAQTLAEFGATVRHETDLDRLMERMVGVMQETLQPESVAVWLKPTADRAWPRDDGGRRAS